MEELKKALDEVFKDDIIKIVISNKLNKEVKYNKIAVNLKETIVDCETNFKNWTKILIKAKYRKMIGIWIKISKKAHTKKA